MTIDENKFDCQDCIGNEVKERLKAKEKGRCNQGCESYGARFWHELRKVCGSNKHEAIGEEVNELDYKKFRQAKAIEAKNKSVGWKQIQSWMMKAGFTRL